MERAELLGAVAARSGVPVIASFLGDALPAADRLRLRGLGVICARDPVEAVRYLGWLWHTRPRAQSARGTGPALGPAAAPSGWQQTADFLATCGLTAPAWRIVGSGAEATRACAELHFPVAVKALPEEVDHKTELGLVRLNISVEELATTVDELLARMSSAGMPRGRILVQEMDKGGVEVLLSALYNEDFGPVLAIGTGGVATELDEDVAYLALPTTPDRVRSAISRLKLARRLAGFRGQPPADLDALAGAASQLGDRFMALGGVRELEINPLFVHPRGTGRLVAVDALVKT